MMNTQQLFNYNHLNETLRWLVTSVFAAVVTTALFLAMNLLIFTEGPALVDSDRPYVPSPIYVPEEITTLKPNPKPVKAKDPVEMPKIPELKLQHKTQIVQYGPSAVDVVKLDHGPMGFSSDQPIPSVLLQPEYPTIASRRGLEGYVELQFDVTAMGTTENIKVLQAEPERVFDRAAIKAVSRWKYSPVIKNGQAQATRGMTHRITFQLDEA